MPYREHFRPEPEEIFESDLRNEDLVILVIGVIALILAFFQP